MYFKCERKIHYQTQFPLTMVKLSSILFLKTEYKLANQSSHIRLYNY